MTTLTNSPDVTTLSSAIECRDVDAIVAWYAEGATLTMVDRDHPPASPVVFSGLDAITNYYRDICGRNINHQVRDLISTPDGLAFTQHCAYPDGTNVLCVTVAHTTHGKIDRQTAVQAWDS
jgi:SnoaL-like domain